MKAGDKVFKVESQYHGPNKPESYLILPGIAVDVPLYGLVVASRSGNGVHWHQSNMFECWHPTPEAAIEYYVGWLTSLHNELVATVRAASVVDTIA